MSFRPPLHISRGAPSSASLIAWFSKLPAKPGIFHSLHLIATSASWAAPTSCNAAAQLRVAPDETLASLGFSQVNTYTLCGCSLPARAECRRYFFTGSACRKQPLHEQIERYTWIAGLHFRYSRLA